jgi:PleD family two-component response regulator
VQKLRQAFSAVDFSGAITGLEVQPTLSIGVAERCKEANIITLDQLLSAADAAVYEAKNSNRNCVRVFSTFRAA